MADGSTGGWNTPYYETEMDSEYWKLYEDSILMALSRMSNIIFL